MIEFDLETGEVLELTPADDSPAAAGKSPLEQERAARAAAEEKNAGLERQVDAMGKEIGRLLGSNSELRGERNRRARESDGPDMPAVRRVFGCWQKECDHDRASLDEDRVKLIRKALRLPNKTEEDLCRAIYGYGRFRFVVDKGRARAGDPKTQRHDGIELVLRNAKYIEKGIALADRADEEDGKGGTLFDAAAAAQKGEPSVGVTTTVLDRTLIALRNEFGMDLVWGDYDDQHQRFHCWWAPCPVKRDVGTPFRIRERKGHGSSLELCCAHGCTEDELHAALDEVVLMHERRRQEAASAAKAARPLHEVKAA